MRFQLTVSSFQISVLTLGLFILSHQGFQNQSFAATSPVKEILNVYSWYSADHQDGIFHFIRARVPGDGDCALHCLNIKRTEFIHKLKGKIKDPAIQKMLKDDLKSAGFKPSTPNGQYNLEQYRDYIKNRLSKSSEYLSFVPQDSLVETNLPNVYTADPQKEGSLAAAATLFNLNVRVWMPAPNGALKLVAKYINNPKPAYIDMLYSYEGKHFDLLVNGDNPEAVHRAFNSNRR